MRAAIELACVVNCMVALVAFAIGNAPVAIVCGIVIAPVLMLADRKARP